MSGKSTYLRQVILLTIMAQIGCFVPAQFATFRITDRIFSRVTNRDCIETNSSTFMVEMQETAFIFNNLGESSLGKQVVFIKFEILSLSGIVWDRPEKCDI